jgi:hypothetical protein
VKMVRGGFFFAEAAERKMWTKRDTKYGGKEQQTRACIRTFFVELSQYWTLATQRPPVRNLPHQSAVQRNFKKKYV